MKDLDYLWEMVGDNRYAMVTSRGPDGVLRGRPLTTQNGDKHHATTLHYFVAAGSEVDTDVGADAAVHCAYCDPDDDRYVSIGGRARITQDRQRIDELWSKMAEAWFTGGPGDPTLRLLEIDIEHAEYWDVKDSKMVQLFKMAKAAVTGKPPQDMGNHGELDVPKA